MDHGKKSKSKKLKNVKISAKVVPTKETKLE
jgi:hypothetical protein